MKCPRCGYEGREEQYVKMDRNQMVLLEIVAGLPLNSYLTVTDLKKIIVEKNVKRWSRLDARIGDGHASGLWFYGILAKTLRGLLERSVVSAVNQEGDAKPNRFYMTGFQKKQFYKIVENEGWLRGKPFLLQHL